MPDEPMNPRDDEREPGVNPRALALAFGYSALIWAMMYGCYRLVAG